MHGRRVALPVLVHEEEVQELGIAPCHQPVPWHRYQQHHRNARKRMQAPPQRQVARDAGVRHQRQPRQHQPGQPLGQQRNTHCRPARQHPVAPRRWRGARVLRQQHARQCAGQDAGERHVERIEVSRGIPHRRRCQHQPRQPARARAEPARRRQHRRRHAGQSRKRYAQPGLPFADAEQRVRERRHPHVEGRLFEVLQPVIADRDPVAADQHLARDLGVAALVRSQQVARAQRAEPQQRERQHGERERNRGDASRADGMHGPRGEALGVRQYVGVGRAGGQV
ncbi:hypothetical protein D3C81_888890 [compost metagenome]